MKIIIIGSANPLRGGLAAFNERLALACIEQKHSTINYSFSLQYPSFLFPGKSQFTHDKPNPALNIKTCINSINPLNWIKIGWEIKNQKPDLILVKFWIPFIGASLGTILRIVRWNKKTKIVCIVDNIIPHEKRIGDKFLTRYFIKPIHFFIAMSQKVFSDLAVFKIQNKSHLLYHPLYDNFGKIVNKNDAKTHLHINHSDQIILFFGFIRAYKGLDILLKAVNIYVDHFKQQQKKVPLLLIAGEFYEDSQKYKDLIQNLEISQYLILKTDFIPDNEVKYYFSVADLIVQPYKRATQSGVTPLAYHFEIPMLVTNVGGLPEMVEHNITGLISEPNEFDIAQKIIDFYEYQPTNIINNIIIEKQKFSWDNFLNRILTITNK